MFYLIPQLPCKEVHAVRLIGDSELPGVSVNGWLCDRLATCPGSPDSHAVTTS